MPRKPKEDPLRRRSRRNMMKAMTAIADAHDKLQRGIWAFGDVNATLLDLNRREFAAVHFILMHSRELLEYAGRFTVAFADDYLKANPKPVKRRTRK